ncbi:hypothetical protein [Pseudoxanthomonas wuyuanensis]|uniref:Uncharacterized protein n=1 Tax=Pseudoxanthomonas wuyuanensis TaxID=1073196 RepID=A0A286D050_9GAMM|nr:hypothetical protein [Pseudoxanthomonas wuyuanensis]KAF1722439.1 hypothetical protein CSC75_04235 [Pseudoxanthomonas wuyuanensis]SOD51996.1 hypothetical protein SAMN06296416_101979 [Pseudoxanthomonas wuyuanensis]
MGTFKAIVLGAVLATAMSAALPSAAQTVGYNVRTGDVWVDSRLGEINDYGRRYRDPFIGEMTGYYGAPRSLVVELLDQRRWAPADVYYACALARAVGVPCLEVVREYDRNPGQGWGAVAKRYGIKPGSQAFHALKQGAAGTYGRWGYPVRVDQNVRVDWSQHGPGKSKAPPAAGKKPDRSGPDAGQGADKGKDKGKGQGNPGNKQGRDK